jgi:hypothetical protein
MARLLRDHSEEQQPKLAVIEEPAAVASATTMPMAPFVVVAVTMASFVLAPFVVATVFGRIVGVGEEAAPAAHVSVFHIADIDRDISYVKIYLDLYR